MSSKRVLLYYNAMETLAALEIERQLEILPPQIANSINKAEALAYALNRLPTMYATTLEGWYWQQERAKESLADLLVAAVRWGIKAAQRKRKNLRAYTPLSQTIETIETIGDLQIYEMGRSNDNIICKNLLGASFN